MIVKWMVNCHSKKWVKWAHAWWRDTRNIQPYSEWVSAFCVWVYTCTCTLGCTEISKSQMTYRFRAYSRPKNRKKNYVPSWVMCLCGDPKFYRIVFDIEPIKKLIYIDILREFSHLALIKNQSAIGPVSVTKR